MTFDDVRNRIMDAWKKSEKRAENLAKLFDEEFPNFDDKEFRNDIIDSILAETLYRNDPMAQEVLKRIKNKYR